MLEKSAVRMENQSESLKLTPEFFEGLRGDFLNALIKEDVFKEGRVGLKVDEENDYVMNVALFSKELIEREALSRKFQNFNDDYLKKMNHPISRRCLNLVFHTTLTSINPETLFFSFLDLNSDFLASETKGKGSKIRKLFCEAIAERAKQAGFKYITCVNKVENQQCDYLDDLVESGFYTFLEMKPEFIKMFQDTLKMADQNSESVFGIRFLDSDEKAMVRPERLSLQKEKRTIYVKELEWYRKSGKLKRIFDEVDFILNRKIVMVEEYDWLRFVLNHLNAFLHEFLRSEIESDDHGDQLETAFRVHFNFLKVVFSENKHLHAYPEESLDEILASYDDHDFRNSGRKDI